MSAYIPLAHSYNELTRDVPYERFADFYEEVFSAYGVKPQMILDLACGTGTLTAILSGRGYEMIGADASPDMLMEAMERAAEGDFAVPPLFLNQSMEELDLYGTVNAAVCSLDGINYVPPEHIPEVFHRLHLFVEPGGVIVFDINTPERLASQDGETFIDETEDVFCVWRAAFSREENAVTYGMDIFTRDGERWDRETEEHTEYAHSVSFLTGALEKAGFFEIRVCGELTLAPPREGEQRVFIAARRSLEY